MNIILFHSYQIVENRVVISDPRVLDHVINVLKTSPGEKLKVGLVNGSAGSGTIESLSENELVMTVSLVDSPPPPVDCTLILAMPRPKVFKRTVQAAITMGIKSIHIIKTWRVDKNYFESPVLESDTLEKQTILALEQAGDTIIPEIAIHRYFKPFIEDVMPALCQERDLFIAHPYGENEIPLKVINPTVLAIGPEGGFIEYEIERFIDAGFVPLSMGNRILRVEQAVPALLGRMFY